MKRLLAFLFIAGLLATPTYAADTAMEALTDGSATVAGTDHVIGYATTGPAARRYTINSILALKTSVPTLTTPRLIGDASFDGSAAITADAILDSVDLSPTSGTWDLSVLTALTLPAVTAGSGTGVSYTGNNGTVTILGKGDGADEDIKFDLNTTSNVIGVSSTTGATSIDFGSLNLVTTGSLAGGAPGVGTWAAPITDNPYSLTAANSYNSVIYYGATGTINHVDAVAKMNFCVMNTGAFTVTINPGDNTVIVREGTAQSAGVSMTLSSGAGNFVCFHSDAANHLVTMGFKGTLAQGS